MFADRPTRRGNAVEIRFDTADGQPLSATFEMPPDVDTDDSVDAAVAAGWLPAMARREPLTVDGPLSPRLRDGAERIADILLTWDRALHPDGAWYGRVALAERATDRATDETTDRATDETTDRATDEASHRATDEAREAPATPVAPTTRRRTACFFTGGVDSFHTVLRRRDEIDELIFVHGFDLLDNRHDPLNREVSARLRDAAGELGKPLVELQCNLVAFAAASGIGWDDYHGAAMATVAHLLAPRYSKVYIPATTTYDQLYPLGSHPLLDPLWSSERVELVHDGADATRIEKLQTIAHLPAAARHLRVCTENRGGAYNCGTCEKCVRTGVGIRIAGVEGAFASLSPPSLRRIATIEVRGRALTWHSYLAHLRHTGANPRLRWAIEAALARRTLRQRWARRRR